MFFGHLAPDVIAWKGSSFQKAMSHMWLTQEGVFGVALGVSTSMVFLFVLFGSLLERAGDLLDIGSGGGLPGMVIAIADQQRPVVLLDRSEKKCRFLAQASVELALPNVEVVCCAAENLDRAEAFSYVVSRAVAPPDVVWKWAEPLLEKQGKMLHMTGDQQISERSKS